MLSHTFTFTAHLASSLRWQFHEDSYIQHKNEQNWLLHKKQMYKFFSPESFIKKKKKFTVKILPHINSAIPSFPSSESELTYSKQFRCQPQSSIISTTDWQWRSPNVHKLSIPFFSRRDRVLYFISQYFISWPSHEVSSSSSSDSAGGTGNWLLCSTAQEFRRALILNSLHFWPEANQEKKRENIFWAQKTKTNNEMMCQKIKSSTTVTRNEFQVFSKVSTI